MSSVEDHSSSNPSLSNKIQNSQQPIYDDEGNLYSRSEIVSIINLVKRDTANFILGDVNGHCNKMYRTVNDNWYPWTESLLKGLNLNKEKLKSLVRNHGHTKLRQICLEEGNEIWNCPNLITKSETMDTLESLICHASDESAEVDYDEEQKAFRPNEDSQLKTDSMTNDLKYGKYCERLERCCNKLNKKLASKKGVFTQWGVLKFRSILKMASEKVSIENKEGMSMATLKDAILSAREIYYSYKKEKYEIIHKYYHEGKL